MIMRTGLNRSRENRAWISAYCLNACPRIRDLGKIEKGARVESCIMVANTSGAVAVENQFRVQRCGVLKPALNTTGQVNSSDSSQLTNLQKSSATVVGTEGARRTLEQTLI